MFEEYFARTGLLFWPLVALAIFFVTFVGVLVYVFVVRRDRASFDRVASLPLEGDTPPVEAGVRKEASA